ncbi:hypothetical protein BDF20DRAFT_909725 [Mycotypha africana]|uniref:uncharacterized protein n=1 Tax=Mycotypha africana TaxID=64632 RepID=UPI0022FFC4B5|nr:uncharacterized protein BDF20DRAFT_909725 [Mycotypha africana]KAI8992035.1 hypothetical protein BDF20DRAFT_909725 [Mycotypha africana]
MIEVATKKSTTLNDKDTITKLPNIVKQSNQYSVFDHDKVLPSVLPIFKELEEIDLQIHHWEIDDWTSLSNRCHGPIFKAAGYEWRVLLFPKGNGGQHDMVSIYLEVVRDNINHNNKNNTLSSSSSSTSSAASSSNDKNWSVCAQFAIVISNPDNPKHYFSNNAHHRFCQEEIDWGFTRFYELKQLLYGKHPYINHQNRTTISIFLRVVKDETGVLWHNLINYDSRKETGYVGIKNQGATCYMNSLIQSLYFTNVFRRAVYKIPTEKEDPNNSVALALQRCFYNLQFSDEAVGTTELTKSFGWDSLDSFMQHDVQEFSRVLQDSLEARMKNIPAVDGAVNHIFMGKMKSYIKCINVDYESSRVEDFYDIQLNVKGCKDLHESFQKYVDVEILDGENKYMAEGHGLQDAKKGVSFESFPPVLHLQLKRFEYDMYRDTMVKINDRHVFPDQINLNEFCSVQSEDPKERNYVLHGVLVHSGDIDGGHYFALLKPEKNGKWYRFDDDRVTPVALREVFEDNYGDDPYTSDEDEDTEDNKNQHKGDKQLRCTNIRELKRFTNAYMLVYFQETRLDEILQPIDENEDIPKHLRHTSSRPSLRDNAKAFKNEVLNNLLPTSSPPHSPLSQQLQQQHDMQQGTFQNSNNKNTQIRMKKSSPSPTASRKHSNQHAISSPTSPTTTTTSDKKCCIM